MASLSSTPSPNDRPTKANEIDPLCSTQTPAQIELNIISALNIPNPLLVEPNVQASVSAFVEVFAQRGFFQVEALLLNSFAAAFLQPRKELGKFEQRLERVLALATRLLATNFEKFELSNVTQSLHAIANLKGSYRRQALIALHVITPGLSSPQVWQNLFQFLANAYNHGDKLLAASNETQGWTCGPGTTPSTSAEARVALMIFRINNGDETARQFKLIRKSRNPKEATDFGDTCRAKILTRATLNSNFPLSWVLNRMQLVSQAERISSGCANHLLDVIQCVESDPVAFKKALNHVGTVPSHELGGTLPIIATLAKAGLPITHLTPRFLNFFHEQYTSAIELYGDAAHIRNLAVGVAAFLERQAPDELKAVSDKVFEALKDEFVLEAIEDPRHAEKLALVLSGRNLPPKQRLARIEDFSRIVVELKAHALIVHAVHTEDSILRRQGESALASNRVGSADNPPFSIHSSPDETKSNFMSQMRGGFRRILDGYYGFWSQTYPMRRSPESQTCYFDNFAAALGNELKVVVARDINRFPGRGRIIEGLRPEVIFASRAADADRDPFYAWKKHFLASMNPPEDPFLPGQVHPIDDLGRTRFLLLRGCRAVTVPDSKAWVLEGEHMTYVEYNHHFEGTGINIAFLVPSRVFWPFVDPYSVPYRPGDPFPEKLDGPDIIDNPPTVGNLRDLCWDLGTRVGVINLGTGSNYFGGFCNGADIGSKPHHVWERQHNQYLDAFGHSHKWHVRSDSSALAALHQFHEEINEILLAATDRLDIFKIADSIYAWGQANEAGIPDLGEPWQNKDDGENDFGLGELQKPRPFSLGKVGDDGEIELPDIVDSEGWQSRTTRMLELGALWMKECRAKGSPKSQTPILVITPTLFQARNPISPFIFDTATGFVWRKGQPPLMFQEFDGSIPDEIRDWWVSEVAPLAYTQGVMPRLVARDNYLDQLKDLGAKVYSK